MKNLLLKPYLFLTIIFDLVACNNLPEKEIKIAMNTLDSAKLEGVNIKFPQYYYFLHDAIYKVLEEIEQKESKLFTKDYGKEKNQLRMLVYQLENIRRVNKIEEKTSGKAN